jgi:hypothetical protein
MRSLAIVACSALTLALASLSAHAAEAKTVKTSPVLNEPDIAHVLFEHGKWNGTWRPWIHILGDITVMSMHHNVPDRKAPLSFTVCDPDDKQRCVESIWLGLTNDEQWKFFAALTYYEGPQKLIYQRAICWFTEDRDMRQCTRYGEGDPNTAPVEKWTNDEWSVVDKDGSI